MDLDKSEMLRLLVAERGSLLRLITFVSPDRAAAENVFQTLVVAKSVRPPVAAERPRVVSFGGRLRWWTAADAIVDVTFFTLRASRHDFAANTSSPGRVSPAPIAPTSVRATPPAVITALAAAALDDAPLGQAGTTLVGYMPLT